MREFWVNSGLALLDIDDDGGLHVNDPFLRAYLLRPELAPVAESCAAETRLHDALLTTPHLAIGDSVLAEIVDADVIENYRHFLRFRDRLLAAPTLQAAYLQLHRDAQSIGRVDVPPLFIDQLAQIILHQILVDETDPIVLRAAELWFRPQRVMLDAGRVVVADAQTLDDNADPGMGGLGRMLAAGGLAAGRADMEVLNDENAPSYFGRDEAFDFALEITHGRAGSLAIARLCEQWIVNMLGVAVKVRPLVQIDDARWRWHIGLDASASRLLDRLYAGELLEPDEQRRLLLLARLDFETLAEQRQDIAGKPVYLALAMDENSQLRFKPQNLLLNLPVAKRQ